MLIAQVSDLHICPPGRLANGVVDTRSMAESCLRAVCALNPLPDVLLLTGDLVEAGDPEEYAVLRTLLAPLPMPWHVLPGNHDERDRFRTAFADRLADVGHLMAGKLQYALDLGAVRVLALDTVVAHRPHGALCAERLDWLAQRLREDERPTLIAMHHPPFATGIAHMDAMGLLEGADALEALVRKHPHVQALLCGHLHRSIQTRFGGALASTCPSPVHQIALNLLGRMPDGYVMEPPGFQLHLWHAGRLVSHTAVVGDFGGTRPFGSGAQAAGA